MASTPQQPLPHSSFTQFSPPTSTLSLVSNTNSSHVSQTADTPQRAASQAPVRPQLSIQSTEPTASFPTVPIVPTPASPAQGSARRSFVFPIRSVLRDGRGSDGDGGPAYPDGPSPSSSPSSSPIALSVSSPLANSSSIVSPQPPIQSVWSTASSASAIDPLSPVVDPFPTTLLTAPAVAELDASVVAKAARSQDVTLIVQNEDGAPELVNDMSGIIRLSDPPAPKGASAPPKWPTGPGGAALSVQNFVNDQARIEHMSDPNANDSSPDIEQPNPFQNRKAKGGSHLEDLTRTSQFQHVEIEGGHYVTAGRTGQVTRCEDEPIATPGAVQGFGVLIVLNVDMETGDMNVRQASENITELLGLSLHYLFGLSCFSDLLLPADEDALRDVIETLEDPDTVPVNEFEGPRVCRLSGFGEPGSDDGTTGGGRRARDSLFRREWCCWVAIHRPKQRNWRGRRGSGDDAIGAPQPYIVILEMELERDNYNPLSPAFELGDSSVPKFVQSFESSSNPHGIHNSGLAETWVSPPTSARSPPLTRFTSEGSVLSTNASRLPRSFCPTPSEQREGLDGADFDVPLEAIVDSTTNYARPLRALKGMRRGSGESNQAGGGSSKPPRPSMRRRSSSQVGARSDTLDVFAIQKQINEQLDKAVDLESFLKVVVGVIHDVTRFHRVLVYEFDKDMNGEVVAEIVEWDKTTDLYKGLHFPASDIPAQAREMYKINKVRFLYDRGQETARLVLRDNDDLKYPLDMTYCFLRAMSPVHLKYLANMKVRSSMSISIMAFGNLWGLIMCHSYGPYGMRVSFPVRRLLGIISDHISRGVERLSYAQRLRERQPLTSLANLRTLESSPSHWFTDRRDSNGYIVTNADQLLTMFGADSGLLVIDKGCKFLGDSGQGSGHAHAMLEIAEYLRVAKFADIRASDCIFTDCPELRGVCTADAITGLLYIPLSSEPGQDFIVLFRKNWIHQVRWAGRPFKQTQTGGGSAKLEPRSSFKAWAETVTGKSKPWTEYQLESATIMSLIYGKFIHLWRQRQQTVISNQLTTILLSNTSHAVRTPLSQIINTLEVALAGNLDHDTRDMLENSHQASRALLFHVHDLLDLTRIETGNETAFNDPFDIRQTIISTVRLYKTESSRRGIDFRVTVNDNVPPILIGDSRKIRTVIANLLSNAVEHTRDGMVEVACHLAPGPDALVPTADRGQLATIEIVVSDTGVGIPPAKLEQIFVTLEGAEDEPGESSVGLGLAVVARIVEQLSGQLRAESEVDQGSKFLFTVKMEVPDPRSPRSLSKSMSALGLAQTSELGGKRQVHPALASQAHGKSPESTTTLETLKPTVAPAAMVPTDSSQTVKMTRSGSALTITPMQPAPSSPSSSAKAKLGPKGQRVLRILVVEDDVINSKILQRRLRMDHHTVHAVENGQEAFTLLASDAEIDAVLMDIQMPIMDGWEAASAIRELELGAGLGAGQQNGNDALRIDGRIPIFAVSASLQEKDHAKTAVHFDGWLLKPLNFSRLRILLAGLTDEEKRNAVVYRPGAWEKGGYLRASGSQV